MRAIHLLVALVVVCQGADAGGGIEIPWEEFRDVYREYVTREVLGAAKMPQVYSLDEAQYVLDASADCARGEVRLTGRVLSGEPAPIPLFAAETVVTAVKEVTGGVVLRETEGGGAAFLAERAGQEFQLALSFLVTRKKEDSVWVLSMPIPRALRNSLELCLPDGAQLVEEPGIDAGGNRYWLPAASCLSVKYVARQEAAGERAIDVDSLSRIQVRGNRIDITTWFLSNSAAPVAISLCAPEGAAFESSSLDASRIRAIEANRCELRLPPGKQEPFSVAWTLDVTDANGGAQFSLPHIEGNTAQEGRFVIDEPDDAEVTATAEGLVSRIPIERAGPVLCGQVNDARYFMKVPEGQRVVLSIRRLQAVAAPAVVLECQYLFCSFEENGGVLSVLVLDVPAEAGTRMNVAAVPGAEIWSLRVNDKSEAVYTGGEDAWIVPLEGTQCSHVELAFLRKDAKLGLEGRLDAVMPRTGLASREVRVAVSIPERVELLSIEGPLSEASGEGWKLPAEFSGKPHFFAKSFHGGEEMRFSIAYKEPVNRAR